MLFHRRILHHPALTYRAQSTQATAKSNILKSVLYGTRESKDLRDEDRMTHSKRLARGKYVHELVHHNVKPEFMHRYTRLVSEHYPHLHVQAGHHGFLAGAWETLVGDLDQCIYLWEYKGYAGYEKWRRMLAENEKHQAFVRELLPMLRDRHNEICLEFAFWNTSSPRQDNGVYELRTYALKPGHLLEWEMNWKSGLEVRRKYCQPVGAWFSQLGHLNKVHHMWVYPDLEARKRNREEAWKEHGWAETVHNTVPLITDMHSRILKPLAISPLK